MFFRAPRIAFATLLICFVSTSYSHAWFFSGPGKNYASTEYPIMLVGGFFAFDSVVGIEYFYGIADDLRRYGAEVHETDLSEFQSNEFRGEELLREIENYLAMSGHKKVNIIAHSQGAPTARYVASVRPDLIASITSVHGMNKGTELADAIRFLAKEDSVMEAVLENLARAVGIFWSSLSGGSNKSSQSAIAILESANTVDAAVFNQQHPAAVPKKQCGTRGDHTVKGIRYWSWGGTGGRFGKITNPMDLIDDLLLSITPITFSNNKHDGVVPKCGQYLGKPIRHNYKHNHVDAVNHLFALIGVTTSPKTLYRNHANRLKKAGL
ncbi:MAG: triacylglycerol lipase [Pseudomonadales bacterium]|nr:triacylglycerol lipase [Pseudomonadales bacterium]